MSLGPAKLYTFRGKWKQYFLRVGMFYDPTEPVDSTHQSLMLRVDKDNGPKALLLDVFIEEVSDFVVCTRSSSHTALLRTPLPAPRAAGSAVRRANQTRSPSRRIRASRVPVRGSRKS